MSKKKEEEKKIEYGSIFEEHPMSLFSDRLEAPRKIQKRKTSQRTRTKSREPKNDYFGRGRQSYENHVKSKSKSPLRYSGGGRVYPPNRLEPQEISFTKLARPPSFSQIRGSKKDLMSVFRVTQNGLHKV
jgi:hypothetical protein